MSAPGWTGSLLPRWLTDPDYRALSAPAWGLHCWAILWSVQQETDGEIPARTLAFVASPMLSRREAVEAARELVEAALWTISPSGDYRIVSWETTQPTRAEMADRRERWRREKRQQRSGADSGPDTDTDTGVVRTGHGRSPDQKTASSVKEAMKNTQTAEADWWESGYPLCSTPGCDEPLLSEESRASGLCPVHQRVREGAA